MSVRIITIITLFFAFLVAAPVTAYLYAQSTVSTDVRITARLLENGKVEFGLQQRTGDGWGETILPRVNKFPYATADVDRWLFSSPVEIEIDVPTAAEDAPPAEPPPAAASFGDGTYRVGSDITAGTYRAPGGDSCSWERLSGFTGVLDDIIAIEVLETRPIVTILSSDAGFRSRGCGQWVSLAGVGGDRATSFGDGTYRVGVDIAVGTYRAPGGDSCSWERLSGFTGVLDDIIAIEVFQTRPIVTIQSSDVGFKSRGCGGWTQS